MGRLSFWTGFSLFGLLLSGISLAANGPGAVDVSFKFGSTNTGTVNALLVLSDNTIAFGGKGTVAWGVLNRDGSLERPAYPGFPPSVVNALAESRQGVLLLGAEDERYAVMAANGSFADSSFSFLANALHGAVKEIALQAPDGEIIAGGSFRLGSGTNVYGLARVKRTGEIDGTFQSAGAEGLTVEALALTAEGILASYTQTNSSGVVEFGFGRWSRDGVRHTGFDGGWVRVFGADARLTVLEQTPWAGGFIAAVQFKRNGEDRTKLLFLNGEGEPEGESALPEISGEVEALAFPPAEYGVHLIVAGEFTEAGTNRVENLAVFTASGAFEWGLAPGAGANGKIRAVAVQRDGRVLMGGDFNTVAGEATGSVARLGGFGATGGQFLYWERAEQRGFEKLGSIKLELNRSGAVTNELAVQIPGLGTNVVFAPGESRREIEWRFADDNSINGRRRVVVEASSAVGGTTMEVVLLDDETPGTVDPEFVSPLPEYFWAMKRQPDGKMLMSYTLAGHPYILRMNSDGTIDPTFATNGVPVKERTFSYITQLQLAANGKIYAAGTFVTSTTFGTNLLVRLNADGSLDTTFNPRLSTTSGDFPAMISLLPDGKILVAQDGVSPSTKLSHQQDVFSGSSVFRLNSDGTLDRAFAREFALGVSTLWALADGRAIVGLRMATVTALRRYSTNGVLETNFVLRANGNVYAVQQVGETLLIGGQFTRINDLGATNFARVSVATGALDPAFNVETDGQVGRILVREDGKIYISGSFTKVNGVDRYRLARLNADGTLDRNYDPGLGFAQTPNIALLADGRVLATSGGAAGPVNVDGMPLRGLVRLEDWADRAIAPYVEIKSPVDGIIFRLSDAVPPLEVAVRAFDPRGLTGEVIVYVDEQAVATNGLSDFRLSTMLPASAGRHEVKAVARSGSGLASTNEVNFSIELVPFRYPNVQEIRVQGEEVLVRYLGTELQESADLKSWQRVARASGTGTQEYVAPMSEARFYRARAE